MNSFVFRRQHKQFLYNNYVFYSLLWDPHFICYQQTNTESAAGATYKMDVFRDREHQIPVIASDLHASITVNQRLYVRTILASGKFLTDFTKWIGVRLKRKSFAVVFINIEILNFYPVGKNTQMHNSSEVTYFADVAMNTDILQMQWYHCSHYSYL